MHSIIINAATGRMGKELIQAVVSDSDSVVAAALARDNHPLIGTDIGYMVGANPQNKLLSSDLESALLSANVLIDFSLPEHSIRTLLQAEKVKIPVLIGTTGFDSEQLALIEKAATSIPVMLASNYSLGVNSLIHLVTEATKLLSDKSDIEIFEAHHKHKIDSPSGTAISIGEAIAETKGRRLDEIAVYERSGERKKDDIGFAVMRGGETIGTHEVTFALNGELVSLKHEAQTRQCFAQGALTAAKWLIKQPIGLYDMQKMLNSTHF
ncbi:4-hydroxy-tetrahydrodipicolinate reductase [Kangiella sp. HZ709]|nr:4-hydroxy-tetrahydrodipicolinate reductase [Kangiella sp. HZ709]